jgi:glycosyltransferase involved in cell wall biosynthesis
VDKDQRIHYYKNKENRGAAFNFRHVLELSKGKYFMWAAHDDEWENCYVSDLVDCLEKLGPGFIAANFEAQYMDETGDRFDFFAEGVPFYAYRSDSVIDRLKYMLHYNYGNIMYSLYRREVLQKDNLVFVANEIPFLLQMIQSGNWRVLPKVGFYKRTVSATYRQARWEKQGGHLKDANNRNDSSQLFKSFTNLKQLWPYHQSALENIRKAIDTLMIGDRHRTELKRFSRYLIWRHLIELSFGYKRRPF